jgi:hypothetical protein
MEPGFGRAAKGAFGFRDDVVADAKNGVPMGKICRNGMNAARLIIKPAPNPECIQRQIAI